MADLTVIQESGVNMGVQKTVHVGVHMEVQKGVQKRVQMGFKWRSRRGSMFWTNPLSSSSHLHPPSIPWPLSPSWWWSFLEDKVMCLCLVNYDKPSSTTCTVPFLLDVSLPARILQRTFDGIRVDKISGLWTVLHFLSLKIAVSPLEYVHLRALPSPLENSLLTIAWDHHALVEYDYEIHRINEDLNIGWTYRDQNT